MNHARKAIVILDIKQLLRYKEFMLKITTNPRTNVCTLCCDDCNGSCLNRNFIKRNSYKYIP